MVTGTERAVLQVHLHSETGLATETVCTSLLYNGLIVSMATYYSTPRQFSSWLIFWISAAIALGMFLVPAFVIYPFHRQTSASLLLAMTLRQKAPLWTLIAAIVCIIFALVLWRSDSLRRKIVLCSVLSLVAFSAVISRLNYFEWIFHPIDAPKFESESSSKLENPQMILAIRFADDARAYPIREMAYHHVLNDEVGGVPVAVTY